MYLDLLRQAVQLHALSLIGYCLMSNHVHLVVIPGKAEALARALKQTHGRYAAYWNATHASSGLVWQGRFYSCPLDDAHLWIALRYAELNPVRADMVAHSQQWKWSSAAAHCGDAEPDVCLDMTTWQRYWSAKSWRAFLLAGESESNLQALRHSIQTGRPLGTKEFIQSLEKNTLRQLTPQKGGDRANRSQMRDKRSLSSDGFERAGRKRPVCPGFPVPPIPYLDLG